MDIRLIAMDLDGTALQPDRRSFSPRPIAALEEAHNRGIAMTRAPPPMRKEVCFAMDSFSTSSSWG